MNKIIFGTNLIAYREGIEAAFANVVANPYDDPHSINHMAWESGWKDAMEEIQRDQNAE
jgi:hypothetical protein